MSKKKKKKKRDGPFDPKAPILHLKPRHLKTKDSGKRRPHQSRR